jgi:hypothetical protein
MRKTSWDSLKAFAIELISKNTKAEQKKSEPSLKAFVVQLAIFTALVVSYFFLVLSFFSYWLKELFDQNKLVYALVAWALIAAQAVVLEVIAAALLKVVESRIDNGRRGDSSTRWKVAAALPPGSCTVGDLFPIVFKEADLPLW